MHEASLKAAAEYLNVGPWDDDLKDIPNVYLQNEGAFYVVETIESTPKIIAMGALRKVSAQTAETKRMRVLPQFQGQGIGKNLLSLLENKALEIGYKEIILDTTINLESAIRLYSKFGYREYKRAKIGLCETIYMKKIL